MIRCVYIIGGTHLISRWSLISQMKFYMLLSQHVLVYMYSTCACTYWEWYYFFCWNILVCLHEYTATGWFTLARLMVVEDES